MRFGQALAFWSIENPAVKLNNIDMPVYWMPPNSVEPAPSVRLLGHANNVRKSLIHHYPVATGIVRPARIKRPLYAAFKRSIPIAYNPGKSVDANMFSSKTFDYKWTGLPEKYAKKNRQRDNQKATLFACPCCLR